MEILKKINIYGALSIVLIASIIYSVVDSKRYNNALKDSITVIGKVEDVTGGRGPFTVNVKFTYAGKVVESYFSTYNIKGMRDSVKVQLLVSREHPAEYLKFIKIVK